MKRKPSKRKNTDQNREKTEKSEIQSPSGHQKTFTDLVDLDLPEDPEKRLQIIQATFGVSSPIPLPQLMQAYKDVDPALVHVITEQWIAETKHRHQLDITQEDHAYRLTDKSIDRGTLIYVSLIIAGVVLVALGSEVAGIVFTALGGVAQFTNWLKSMIPEKKQDDES